MAGQCCNGFVKKSENIFLSRQLLLQYLSPTGRYFMRLLDLVIETYQYTMPLRTQLALLSYYTDDAGGQGQTLGAQMAAMGFDVNVVSVKNGHHVIQLVLGYHHAFFYPIPFLITQLLEKIDSGLLQISKINGIVYVAHGVHVHKSDLGLIGFHSLIQFWIYG